MECGETLRLRKQLAERRRQPAGHGICRRCTTRGRGAIHPEEMECVARREEIEPEKTELRGRIARGRAIIPANIAQGAGADGIPALTEVLDSNGRRLSGPRHASMK